MSKKSIDYALHNPAAWPNGRADDADEVIRLRGELAELRAKLDAVQEESERAKTTLGLREVVIDTTQKRIADLYKMVQIQTTDKNWNYDRYMHGFANGLMLAYDTMKGVEFVGLNAPDKWVAEYEINIGEVAAVRAQLDAANERARAMAADLSRVAVINAGQANIIWTQAHELDALRRRRHIVTLTDRVQDGYAVDGCEECGR